MIPKPIGKERVPTPSGESPTTYQRILAWKTIVLLTIDIIDLGGPEEKQYEEVATTEECDQKNDDHGLLGLAEDRSRYHGMRRVDFPYEEGDN
jgi:hypothetical protein